MASEECSRFINYSTCEETQITLSFIGPILVTQPSDYDNIMYATLLFCLLTKPAMGVGSRLILRIHPCFSLFSSLRNTDKILINLCKTRYACMGVHQMAE